MCFRTSNDFNVQGHTVFPRWNLYSCILHSHLSFEADFDMFATTPSTLLPVYHALLRSFAPGPTLISDLPGASTDLQILERLTGIAKTGEQVVVKTDWPISTLPSRWFRDDLERTTDGPALIGGVSLPLAQGGMMGCWNIRQNHSVAIDAIDFDDIQDLMRIRGTSEALGNPNGTAYAVWSMGYSKQGRDKVEVIDPLSGKKLRIELDENECEAVVVTPIWSVKGADLAVVGMLDKFASLAGIEVDRQEGEFGLTVH